MSKKHVQRSTPRYVAISSLGLARSGFEDDIVISYCLSQLVPEEALAADVDESKAGNWLRIGIICIPMNNWFRLAVWTENVWGYLPPR